MEDREKVIQNLLAWISASSHHKFVETSQGLATKCKTNCTKVTSDNLRNVVINYEETEQWLRTNYPCLLPQYHEAKPGVVQPRVDFAKCNIK